MTRQYIPAHETFDQSVFFPLSWIPEMWALVSVEEFALGV
jgi:hypothetical protein